LVPFWTAQQQAFPFDARVTLIRDDIINAPTVVRDFIDAIVSANIRSRGRTGRYEKNPPPVEWRWALFSDGGD
jgi:hypothetical protein